VAACVRNRQRGRWAAAAALFGARNVGGPASARTSSAEVERRRCAVRDFAITDIMTAFGGVTIRLLLRHCYLDLVTFADDLLAQLAAFRGYVAPGHRWRPPRTKPSRNPAKATNTSPRAAAELALARRNRPSGR
jgi:hypothetical protein